MSAPTPRVFILVTCRGVEHLPGTLMVFDTLRIGFPTADITVVDNASAPETIPAIEGAAERAWARLVRRVSRIEHGRFINEVLAEVEGPVVFLDTDIVFWESCEGLEIPDWALLAGRLIPRVESGSAIHLPRIHPSFLYVPDAETLHEWLRAKGEEAPYFRGFEAYQANLDGKMWMADTGAAVYGAIDSLCYPFPASYLDKYDHLFMGTIPDQLTAHGLPRSIVQAIREGHRLWAADPAAFRGYWRRQGGGNIEWFYASGRLRTGGKEYGVFVARFHDLVHDEWFAHASLTNYTDGTYAGGPVEIVNHSLVRSDWGQIDLSPVETAPAAIPYQRHYQNGGTTVRTSVQVPTVCHLTLDNGRHIVGLGDFWYEHELGTILPGSGWIWAGITLDDGRAYSVRTADSRTEFIRYTPDGAYAVVNGEIHEDGYTIDGETFTLVGCDVEGRIIDPVRSVAYEEVYRAVFDAAGRKIGFAFVEVVPEGNGLKASGPDLPTMFVRWANGNADAAKAVATLWRASQIADDLADGDCPDRMKSPALLDLILTAAVELQRNPFYVEHRAFLEPAIVTALIHWDASNSWSVSNRRDTQYFAYAHREAFGIVVVAVAYLAGGLEFARNVLRELHAYLHDSGRVESFEEWRKETRHGRSV